jgi:hypothetical protein
MGGEPFVWRRAGGGLLIVIAMMIPELPWDRISAWLKKRGRLFSSA